MKLILAALVLVLVGCAEHPDCAYILNRGDGVVQFYDNSKFLKGQRMEAAKNPNEELAKELVIAAQAKNAEVVVLVKTSGTGTYHVRWAGMGEGGALDAIEVAREFVLGRLKERK
jgi:hypothetical protein